MGIGLSMGMMVIGGLVRIVFSEEQQDRNETGVHDYHKSIRISMN